MAKSCSVPVHLGRVGLFFLHGEFCRMSEIFCPKRLFGCNIIHVPSSRRHWKILGVNMRKRFVVGITLIILAKCAETIIVV